MKNILKIALVTVSASALLIGCIKETFPTSVASSEQVNASPTALEASVNGMSAFVNHYATVSSSAHYDWGYPSICIIREMVCEDMAPVSSSYEWFSGWLKNTDFSSNSLRSQFIWNFYTQFLNTANSVISAVNPETASDKQLAYLAMAYCYRSLINLDMGRMYEFKVNSYTTAPDVVGLTIPIIRENMTEAEARNNPRVQKSVLLDELIIPDLEKAVKFFGGETFEQDNDKSKIYSRSSKIQPDLSVAYGLMARAYMWKEDYNNARRYAELALKAGSYTPLTEAQWTDTTNGFNNMSSQNSWMFASSLVKEDDVVKTGILNWASWMCSETTFGYAAAGPYRRCATGLYSQIPDSDFRKKSWVAPAGSAITVPMIAATGSYDPTAIPELASVKFRPGSADPEDYTVGAVLDFPLMRCEEMYFIIAECDAQVNSSASSLQSFMRSYRNANYTCTASGKSAIVDEVILQKRIEFWGEGIIYFDYKRLKKSVTRGYEGSNYPVDCNFNTIGMAPWFNFVIVRTEGAANMGIPDALNNPDPSGLVELWK